MTTPYIDPNIIFAENAPTQDKPAAFENYDKGWDESRKNDGRPSIKQMNYLQQQADLKNRYIHENGAALPYKEGVTYEENAVVVKDGELQQWKSGEWVNVGAREASDITDASGVTQQEVNDLTGAPYRVKAGGYNIGERVVLENGDIVQSVVAGNTVDPNVDMTGWENFESNTRNIKYANYIDARTFGVIPDKTTDWTSVILGALATLPESSTLYIPQGTLWQATSNPDDVYAAMPNNTSILDDSGYESRYSIPSAERWQSSQQIYYKTKDYGAAGRRNGNGLNLRSDYHSYVNFEIDAPFGTGGCKGSVIFRFNNGSTDSAQFGANGDSLTAAHLGFATYGAYAAGTTALRIGLQSSIAPHSFTFNSSMIEGTSYIFGKRIRKTNPLHPETEAEWKASSHITRISQPVGHTGNFEKLFFYGTSVVARREVLDDTGRHRVITKNNKTLTTTVDGEQFGDKLNILTPTSHTLLSESLSGSYYSNISTGGTLTLTLPKAIKGTYFEFSVDVAQNLVIAPNAADNFTGMAAGKTKTSNTAGSHLRVVAISESQWSFIQSGTWTNQA